ncbi:MAG: hypothetical protein HQK81_15035 [Desulfovibrionaceae bacterium]|nr:hypothetical protein [Desulfovibrionaceae bacterium]MBF0515358.1 hypothetical protein [Desulfovibrionaceae bacterium]
MPFRACLIALLLVLTAATSARAQVFDEEELTQCALQKALASLTCKPPEEFYFLGKRTGIYIYTGYWAMHYTEFYAQPADKKLVLFSSPDWGRERISARLEVDYLKGCVDVRLQKSPCNSHAETKCCAAKPPEPKAP